MARANDYATWGRSLATVTIAALGGPLPAAATAAIGEVVKYALNRYEASAEIRGMQGHVATAIKAWVQGEGMDPAETELGLALATRMIAEYGATDDDAVAVGYDAARALELVASRARSGDRYWDTEPHYEVAKKAIVIVYGTLYSRLQLDNNVLLPAMRSIRGDISEFATQLEAMGVRIETHLTTIGEQISALQAMVAKVDRESTSNSQMRGTESALMVTEAGASRVWPDEMPARNHVFTGRRGHLDDLAAGFVDDGAATIQTVHGMGGVGKSQLAVEYAHLHADDYALVWWFTASEPALISDSARRLLDAVGTSTEGLNDERVVGALHALLARTDTWLLIFDNAEQADAIQRWVPSMPRSAGARGHALVTTRRGGFSTVGIVVEVEVWDPGEALAFLQRRLPGCAVSTLERLAEAMGRLPLALEQASAYVGTNGLPCADYLQLFEERRTEMLSRGRVIGHREIMATLWDISLAAIEQHDAAASELIGVCAYMGNTAIPLRLFIDHADVLPERLSAAAADLVSMTEAVGVLVDYAMCKRSGEQIAFHILTQSAVQAKHVKSGDGASEELSSALLLLNAGFPAIIVGNSEVWGGAGPWSDLLPHVLSATEHYISASGANEALLHICVDLLARASTYSLIRGDLSGALELAERARSLMESSAVSEEDLRWRAGRYVDSARAYKETNNFEAALPLAERALELMGSGAVAGDLDLATDTALVGTILFEMDQYPAALKRAKEALKMGFEGQASPRFIARRLNEVGLNYLNMRAPSQAIGPVRTALRLARGSVGEKHPEYIGILANLGSIHLAIGSTARARSELEDAVGLMEEAVGDPNHPNVGKVLFQLLEVYEAMGEEGLAEAARGRIRRIFGIEHVVPSRRVTPTRRA